MAAQLLITQLQVPTELATSAGNFLQPLAECRVHRVLLRRVATVEMASTGQVAAEVVPASTVLTQVLVAVVALAGQFFSGVLNMRVAALKNNVLVAVLEARDLADAQDSMPDCVVRLATPADIPVVVGARQITPKEFRDLFTEPELAAIVMSADPGAQMLLYKIATTGATVDMDSSDVQNGLLYLQSKGLLTATRRLVIQA
jgi:hypothetical protein